LRGANGPLEVECHSRQRVHELDDAPGVVVSSPSGEILLVAVGDLPWYRNPDFRPHSLHEILVGIQNSVYAVTNRHHRLVPDPRWPMIRK